MENAQLRHQLNSLLAKARENEEKLLRFERLEQQLMATRALAQLIVIMLQDFPLKFGLDEVSLVLLDNNNEWAHSLGRDKVSELTAMGLVLSHDLSGFAKLYSQPFRPHLSVYQSECHFMLFRGVLERLGSVALLPLVRHGQLIGGLHLASRDKYRFALNDGTFFLERLAAFFSLCLENTLYYDKLERFGLMDALTQVNNRHYFDLRLKEAVNQALRYRQPLVAIMFDLDHFKAVNDQWGHQIGDYILQQVVRVIQALLRGSDSFARYGGEEFVALLPNTDEALAIDIAERIRLAIADYAFSVGAESLTRLSVSVGVAQIVLNDACSEEVLAQQLISAADAALYCAKAQGRNRVVASV